MLFLLYKKHRCLLITYLLCHSVRKNSHAVTELDISWTSELDTSQDLLHLVLVVEGKAVLLPSIWEKAC